MVRLINYNKKVIFYILRPGESYYFFSLSSDKAICCSTQNEKCSKIMSQLHVHYKVHAWHYLTKPFELNYKHFLIFK